MSEALIQTLAGIAGIDAKNDRVRDRLEGLLQSVRDRAAEGGAVETPRRSDINAALNDVQDKMKRLSKAIYGVKPDKLEWACQTDERNKLASARALNSRLFWLNMQLEEIFKLCDSCKVSAQHGKNKNYVLSDIAVNSILVMMEFCPEKVPKKATEASSIFKLYKKLISLLNDDIKDVSHLDILNRELGDPKARQRIKRAQELHAIRWGESSEKI